MLVLEHESYFTIFCLKINNSLTYNNTTTGFRLLHNKSRNVENLAVHVETITKWLCIIKCILDIILKKYILADYYSIKLKLILQMYDNFNSKQINCL